MIEKQQSGCRYAGDLEGGQTCSGLRYKLIQFIHWPPRQAVRLYWGGTHLHICTLPLGNICTLELEPSDLTPLSQFLCQVLWFPASCIVADHSSTAPTELTFELVNRKNCQIHSLCNSREIERIPEWLFCVAGEGRVLGLKTSNGVTHYDIHMSNRQQSKIRGNNQVLVSCTITDVVIFMVKLLEFRPNPYVKTLCGPYNLCIQGNFNAQCYAIP